MTSRITPAAMAMPRKMRCQLSGTISDVIATTAVTPTRTTLMMPIAVRSRMVDAVETAAGMRSSSSTTRKRFAGEAADGEVRHGISGEAHAEEAPERRALVSRKTEQPAEGAHEMPRRARQEHQRQQHAELPRLPQRLVAIDGHQRDPEQRNAEQHCDAGYPGRNRGSHPAAGTVSGALEAAGPG